MKSVKTIQMPDEELEMIDKSLLTSSHKERTDSIIELLDKMLLVVNKK